MTFFKTLTLVGAALGAAVILTAPVAAKDKKDEVSTKFYACSTIDEDADRLVCYDDLAKSMNTAQTSEKIEARKVAEAKAFGAEEFASKEEINEIERLSQIESRVTNIRLTPSRHLWITLENGQVWRQDPSDKIIPAPKDGVEYTASIRRAMFGRYIMKLQPSGRNIRVKRYE